MRASFWKLEEYSSSSDVNFWSVLVCLYEEGTVEEKFCNKIKDSAYSIVQKTIKTQAEEHNKRISVTFLVVTFCKAMQFTPIDKHKY